MLSLWSTMATEYLNNIFILTIKSSCVNMQIRPTALTVGLIVCSFVVLFYVYTEFGVDSLVLLVTNR